MFYFLKTQAQKAIAQGSTVKPKTRLLKRIYRVFENEYDTLSVKNGNLILKDFL